MQVMFLSEIVTGDGKRIQETALECSTEWERDSKWEWPTKTPTREDKKLWREALRTLTSATYEPRQSLGPWKQEPHIKWKWYWEPEHGYLMRELAGICYRYNRTHARSTRGQSVYKLQTIPISAPMNLVRRATVRHIGSGPARNVIYEGSAAREPAEANPVLNRQTIAQMIAEDTNGWMYEHSKFPNDGREIAEAMRAALS